MQKENGDLRASLREVERSRLEARRELQELRRQVSNRYYFQYVIGFIILDDLHTIRA